MVWGGWGNGSGLQHKGCMCEVINLRDLLHFFFCPYSPHTAFGYGIQHFLAASLLHRKVRMMLKTLSGAHVVNPFTHILKFCETISKELST